MMQSGLHWFGLGSRYDDAKWIALVWARVRFDDAMWIALVWDRV
jgi:hypothetical protein